MTFLFNRCRRVGANPVAVMEDATWIVDKRYTGFLQWDR